MTLRDLLLILQARWRVIAMTTIASVLLVTGINLSLPKQYRASATVVVDIKGADPIAGNNAQAQVIPGYLATQVGVVSSDRVVQKVIQALNLEGDPVLHARWQDAGGWMGSMVAWFNGLLEDLSSRPDVKENAEETNTFGSWLTARLRKRLDVRPAREGSLIDIAVNWDDPARAAQIANAFARAYISTNLELKVEPAKHYVAWFEERNQALRKNLEQAQARLSQYQREKGIVAASDARLDIENARLGELSSQLTALQGTRADSASREQEANGGRDSMTEMLQNPVIINLKGELSKLELRRAEIAKRFGANYPDLQRIDEQVSAVNERLTQETNRVVASLRSSNKINLQRETEIRAGLDAQRARVLELSRQRDEIAVLQYDVTNAQRAYDTVTQRLAQTSLESQSQMTNVMIITPAIQPMGADSPRIKVNMALALVFGFLLGIAIALLREKLDQRLYGPDQLRHVLGAPVFGALGQKGMALTVRGPRRLALRP
jgi:chain length determinant protein EpsF